MKALLHGKSHWLRRLLVLQVLLSVVAAALVIGSGEYASLGYSLAIGLLPSAIIGAYLFHVPYATLMLRAYSAVMAAIGGLVLTALLVSGAGNWLTPSRLVLGAQVAVAVLLFIALSNSGKRQSEGRR